VAWWLLILGGCGDEPLARPWPAASTAETVVIDTGGSGDTADPDDTGGVVDTGGTVDTGSTADTGPVPLVGPVLYPDDRVQSPITGWVASELQRVAGTGTGQVDVFMKVGASSTVSSSTLACYAGDRVDLDRYHELLAHTWRFHLDGDAAGDTPYDRSTLAAKSGKTAAWVIDGSPSPLEDEIAAIDPSVAVIHYGTNDMGMGSTYESAMPGFYEAMAELLDGLIDDGIVPVVTGISHRGDREAADLWAETYNAVIRGMAQVRQVPFIDLHLAMDPLDDHGLASDGLHLNGYAEGDCVLTPEGLEHGYPMRNLIVLQALDRVAGALWEGDDPPDSAGALLGGEGSPARPFVIDDLPFADGRDTRDSAHRNLDAYSGCDSTADESGPELSYRFSLARETALRLVVLDQGSTDIDVHLLDETGSEAGCLARDDRAIAGTLAAGDYRVVLDSWVDSGGDVRAGEYLFVIQPCEPGDEDCATRL